MAQCCQAQASSSELGHVAHALVGEDVSESEDLPFRHLSQSVPLRGVGAARWEEAARPDR
jgi:hypothetical protein